MTTVQQPIKHDGYLQFLENEANPDLEGLIKALTTIVPTFVEASDLDIFGAEVIHSIALNERIDELLKKYPMRIWFFGTLRTRREKLRAKLIEAKAHASVAAKLLRVFAGKI